jgi:ribosome-associated translation inhibitor RaiA
MRIDVIAEGAPMAAAFRAYAEFRLFSTLARHTRAIRSVRVILEHTGIDRETCVIEVALDPSGSARARGHARHACGAIDRAAERIGQLMNRKVSKES